MDITNIDLTVRIASKKLQLKAMQKMQAKTKAIKAKRAEMLKELNSITPKTK